MYFYVAEYEEQDKKFGREDSITDIKPKEQNGSKTGRLYLYSKCENYLWYYVNLNETHYPIFCSWKFEIYFMESLFGPKIP